MHRTLGGNGERCHTMDSGVPRRTKSRHKLHCTKCAWVATVGPTRYKRQKTGRTQYLCNLCRSFLSV
jgi:predicted SprT family Zn-dependent metalloprotease